MERYKSTLFVIGGVMLIGLGYYLIQARRLNQRYKEIDNTNVGTTDALSIISNPNLN